MVESVQALSVPNRGAWREKMGWWFPVDSWQNWQLFTPSGGQG